MKQEEILISKMCEVDACGLPAIAHVQWGIDQKHQQGNLCNTHVQELWSKINRKDCFWIQGNPK
jgi:hypothetical protein